MSRLAARILQSNFTTPHHPFKLTFIVTYRCNLQCNMCSIWEREIPPEITLDEVRTFFQQSRGFSWINFSGGESFLRPDFVDLVRAAADECPYLFLVDFPTNGTMPERVIDCTRQMLDLGIPKIIVTVSVDGPERIHDRIRGVEGSWRNCMATFQGLRRLRSPAFEVYLGCTLQEDNADALDDAVKDAQRIVPDIHHRDFHVNIAHVAEHYYDNARARLGDPAKLYDKVKAFQHARGLPWTPVALLERRYHELSEKYLKTGRNPLQCKSLSSSCFLDPYGDVYPCTIYGEKVGNIRDFEYSMEKLWRSEKAGRLRGEILHGDCPHCWTPCEAYQTILGNALRRGFV